MINIQYYRKMKNVERLGGQFKLRGYNLLEHCYMVAVLFRQFASKEDVAYDINDLDVILHHDIVEVVTTDLPYPVKKFSEKTEQAWSIIEDELVKRHFQLKRYTDDRIKETLTGKKYDLFKVCDLLDLWIFCIEEMAYGNTNQEIIEVINKCETLVKGKFISVDKFMETYSV